MSQIDPKALFRLSVLGPLVSREQLARGELQEQLHELAQRDYAIPGSERSRVAEMFDDNYLGRSTTTIVAG